MRHKIAWIRSLVSRINRICSLSKLKQELQYIKELASWNGFPKRIVNSLMQQFSKNTITNTDNKTEPDDNTTTPTIWLEMPYIGDKGGQLLRTLKKKLQRCLRIPVIIRTKVRTTRLNMYTNTKDQVAKQNKSSVVYQFTCPTCTNNYIGKTDRTVLERCKEHAYTDKNSAIYTHIRSCNDLTKKTNAELTNHVLDNTKVLDSSNNWNILLYKEALHIRRRKPEMNNGLKASRELSLFI